KAGCAVEHDRHAHRVREGVFVWLGGIARQRERIEKREVHEKLSAFVFSCRVFQTHEQGVAVRREVAFDPPLLDVVQKRTNLWTRFNAKRLHVASIEREAGDGPSVGKSKQLRQPTLMPFVTLK